MNANPQAVTPPSTAPAASVRGRDRARCCPAGAGRKCATGPSPSRCRCHSRRRSRPHGRPSSQRCRRRNGSSSISSAEPFATSSISGVANSAPRDSPRAPWCAIRKSLVQPFARIATVVAAHAPHARQNSVCRIGTRAVWFSHASAPSTNGSGSSDSPRPTSSPVVPV